MNGQEAPEDQGGGQALAGVQVLDLSEGIAGPFAARLLGDFGAQVTKVEKPLWGDSGRQLQPRVSEENSPPQSLMFEYLNWNKRSVALDLSDGATRRAVQRLVERSQIVIESFAPGTLQAWGLDPEQLWQWNPSLVLVSITPFGQTGPYAHYQASDLVLQAMSGVMQISGRVDREPLKHGLSQSYFCAGLNAAYAALAAYLAASLDGVGEHVDLSIMECLASELVYNQPFYAFLGAVQGRRAVVQDPFDGEPIPGRQGYVAVQAGGGAPFEHFADLLGIAELADPKYATPRQRMAHATVLRDLLTEALADRDPQELFASGAARRLLIGVVQTARDLLACPHLSAREFFVDLPHPVLERIRFPGELVKMSQTPMQVRHQAPRLDEHGLQVLQSELKFSDAELAAMRAHQVAEPAHA